MSLLWVNAARNEEEDIPRPPLQDEYFHGTTHAFKPGDRVLPVNRQEGGIATYPFETSKDHAYATLNEGDAWHYAENGWGASSEPEPGDHPKVFRVRPVGHLEHDPMYDDRGRSRGNFEGDVRSRDGFEVLDEVPMPERMGRPEDWR